MMKKTLLSIISMAALLSVTTTHAAPFEKNITVEAKIIAVIKLTKANGTKLDNIKLDYDYTKNDGSYTNTTGIKIIVTNADPKVKIKLAEDFKLVDSTDNTKEFTDHSVTLNGDDITTGDGSFNLAAKQFAGDLTITAKQPAVAAGTYSGTLKLVLESEA